MDFVKIKNLQAADFTIDEIKVLLNKSDQQVYAAFDEKIAEQTQKLNRIREIQKSYLAEQINMEQIVYSITDYLPSQCARPQILQEFGLEASDAPAILHLLRDYLNEAATRDLPPGEMTMTVNEEVIQGQEAILSPVRIWRTPFS